MNNAVNPTRSLTSSLSEIAKVVGRGAPNIIHSAERRDSRKYEREEGTREEAVERRKDDHACSVANAKESPQKCATEECARYKH